MSDMKNKIIVSPSLLSCDFLNIEKELQHFDSIPDIWFHLDIMDGHFVPNLTFGHPIIELIGKKSKHPLDAHLMVTNPQFYIETLQGMNIHNLTFHWESAHHHDRLIQQIKDHYPSAGISLNPSTSLSIIPDYILKKIDLVLIMSVNPGFGGQSFIEASIEKIEQLNHRKQKLNANFQIQVDGGVTDKNAQALINAGAQNLVAGSYVFKTAPSEYANKVKSLRTFAGR